MKTNILTLALLFLTLQTSVAQEVEEKEEKKEKATSFVIIPTHNSVAGFSNIFLGTSAINEKLDFTFYGVFWTNPSFGTPKTGSDLLLETGIGLGFKLLENKLYLNPTLGIASGKFVSGGDQTLLAEGLIPNVLALYNNGPFELEAYLAYYTPIRKGGDVTRDILLNWIVPGVKVSKKFSIGAYYEQLVFTRTTDDLGEKSLYQWLGGYAKISLNNNVWFRVAAGANLFTELNPAKEFFKVQAFIPIK